MKPKVTVIAANSALLHLLLITQGVGCSMLLVTYGAGTCHIVYRGVCTHCKRELCDVRKLCGG